MKYLTTAFAAIVLSSSFPGFGMAVPQFDMLFNTTQDMTTIYNEGSTTTTLKPILHVDHDLVPLKMGKDLFERVKRLKEDFPNYETKVIAFVSNVTEFLTSFYFDTADNLVELTNYLPSDEKKISRRKCYCEGKFREPCPQRCINSCYIPRYGGHHEDCTTVDHSNHYNYYCYDGSAQITGRDVTECYDPPTVEPCSEFAVNHTYLKESFLNFAKLLVEPARIKVRGVQRNLKFVRESIRSMDILSYLSWQHCRDPKNMLCFPEATELIEAKVKYYEQLAKNITVDLIDTQTEIDRIEENMSILTEGAIKQFNDARKDYTCCLKGLNFQVEGVECKGPTTKATVQATQLATLKRSKQFICNNGQTIPGFMVCNGVDDCGDNSDEAQCLGK